MGWPAWAVFAISIGCLTLAPGAHSAGPSTIVHSATVRIEYSIPLDLLLENMTLRDRAAPEDPCGGPSFEKNPNNGSFRFAEPATATGCGELGYLFSVPPGATGMVVRFNASRQLVQASQPQFPIDAPQLFKVYDEANRLVDEVGYFEATAGSRPERPFGLVLPEAPGSSRINVTWYFADDSYRAGLPVASTGTNQAYSGTVRDPRILVPSYPLSAGRILAGNETRTPETLHNASTFAVTVPPLARGPNDTLEVQFSVVEGANVTGFIAPDGSPIPPEEFARRDEGGNQIFSISPAQTRRFGPGDYGVLVERTTAIPPAPPVPPTRVYPLALALLVLPAVPGAMAFRSGARYRKEAEQRFLATARTLLLLVAGVALFYLAILGYVWLGGRFTTLATLPFSGESWLTYAQLVLATLGFLALWVIPDRVLLRSMRRDIEERKRLEEELLRSNEELEHFAYIASHDLQEPLRTISGFSQLLQRKYGNRLDATATRYIDHTVAGSQRMSRLINDLLSYSRVDTRGRDFAPVDTNKAFDDTLTSLEAIVRERRAEVTKDPLPAVLGDATQIEQVFSNLIRNAVKYVDPKRTPRVHVSVKKRDTLWEFAVQDNGIGIAREYFDKIFIIFQRLQPREAADSGTGLGLAIVKKIVERHGGTIWVESKLGRGSTFRFTLPEIRESE